jgi:nucleoside 2-deoxyribosyltransferase
VKKIYLAAKYSQKEEMLVVRKLLYKAGLLCTASWLNEPHAPGTTLDQVTENDLCEFAQQDMDDIRRCDIFVLFSVDPLQPTVRGGRHVETGYALGLGRPVHVVGPKENIFHYLPGVKHFTCISELISGIKETEV